MARHRSEQWTPLHLAFGASERGWHGVATSSHRLIRLTFVAREKGQRGVVTSACVCGEGEGVCAASILTIACADIQFRPLKTFMNEHKLRKPAVVIEDERTMVRSRNQQ
jgi:hypothetical protein